MKAQEKATELFNKYKGLAAGYNTDNRKHRQKQCALIAAEEARQEALYYDMATGRNREQFWYDVIQELEKL